MLRSRRRAPGGDRRRNLFDDVVARELRRRARVVLEGEHWVAFVPYAAHWPYEVHLYPQAPGPGPARRSTRTRAQSSHRSIWNS